MHTPEPWKINHDDSTEEWSIVTNQHGSIVANVNEETGPELAGSIPVMRKMPGMENARRIVACVNACRGLPTDELEQKGLVAAVGTQLLAADDRAEGQEREIRKLARTTADAENKLADALNQCDELLAALVAAVECGMVPISSAKDGGPLRHARQIHVADQIRDAIAKAKAK